MGPHANQAGSSWAWNSPKFGSRPMEGAEDSFIYLTVRERRKGVEEIRSTGLSLKRQKKVF